MTEAKRPRIDVHPAFELGLLDLLHSEQEEMARTVDRLGGPNEPAGVARVGGTRRLYRVQVGAWKVLFLREADRILLLSLRGRRG
jgi:hypothetical protein